MSTEQLKDAIAPLKDELIAMLQGKDGDMLTVRLSACVQGCIGLNPEAVPDLLAFAKAFSALFCDSDMSPEDECHELYGLAQDAIAKATGKEA